LPPWPLVALLVRSGAVGGSSVIVLSGVVVLGSIIVLSCIIISTLTLVVSLLVGLRSLTCTGGSCRSSGIVVTSFTLVMPLLVCSSAVVSSSGGISGSCSGVRGSPIVSSVSVAIALGLTALVFVVARHQSALDCARIEAGEVG